MLSLDSMIYGTATIHAVACLMSCSPCLCFSFVHSLICISEMLMNLGGSLPGRKESETECRIQERFFSPLMASFAISGNRSYMYIKFLRTHSQFKHFITSAIRQINWEFKASFWILVSGMLL